MRYTAYFMTNNSQFEFAIGNGGENIYYRLLSVFGSYDEVSSAFKIALPIEMTDTIRKSIFHFCDEFSTTHPRLKGLRSELGKVSIGEFFILLDSRPKTTAETLLNESILSAARKHGYVDDEALVEEINFFNNPEVQFLINNYEFKILSGKKRVSVGNVQQKDRRCRFCGKSKFEGATFRKKAHAMPEGIGNKNIFLYDECDECNEGFGNGIEVDFIEHFNIVRAFTGVQGKEGKISLKYKGGSISNSESGVVVSSKDIIEHEDGISVLLDGSSYNPQNVYRCLCKISISVLEEKEFESVSSIVGWIKGDVTFDSLPLVKHAVVHNMDAEYPVVWNFLRKLDADSKLPTMFSVLQIRMFLYVYIIPGMPGDVTFSLEENFSNFWNAISFFSQGGEWKSNNFSQDKKIKIENKLNFNKRV
jgi:hypothetical protein